MSAAGNVENLNQEEFNLLSNRSALLRESNLSLEELKNLYPFYIPNMDRILNNIYTLILSVYLYENESYNNDLEFHELLSKVFKRSDSLFDLSLKEWFHIGELIDFLAMDEKIVNYWVQRVANKCYKEKINYRFYLDPKKTFFGGSLEKLMHDEFIIIQYRESFN
jgi:hypothetical protein